MIETTISITASSDGQVTITAGGLLDLTNSDKFNSELRAASASANSLVVDLCGAKFIDTAIVQYLANAATAMIGRGKRLKVVVCETGHPKKVLEIVGFSHIMDIETGICSE